MMLSLPYNDDYIIECVCDCSYATTVDGKHVNCMTTGNRFYSNKGRMRCLDYCPAHKTPKWRFVDVMYCDNCNEPFHDIVAWWLHCDVMDYIKTLCGLTREKQMAEAQLYLCPSCVDKILDFTKEEGYDQWKAEWKAERYAEKELAAQEDREESVIFPEAYQVDTTS